MLDSRERLVEREVEFLLEEISPVCPFCGSVAYYPHMDHQVKRSY